MASNKTEDSVSPCSLSLCLGNLTTCQKLFLTGEGNTIFCLVTHLVVRGTFPNLVVFAGEFEEESQLRGCLHQWPPSWSVGAPPQMGPLSP